MRVVLAFAAALLATTPALAQQIDVAVAANADGTRTLTHEVVVPADVERVWAAVTTAEGWRTWAAPVVREIGPDRFETSYNPASGPGAPDTIEQQWLTREAPHRVSFRTTRTPAGFPHAEAYVLTTSTFILTPEGAATRVRLVGEGFPPGEAGDALIDFFTQGNRMALQMLHVSFAKGPTDWGALLGGK